MPVIILTLILLVPINVHAGGNIEQQMRARQQQQAAYQQQIQQRAVAQRQAQMQQAVAQQQAVLRQQAMAQQQAAYQATLQQYQQQVYQQQQQAYAQAAANQATAVQQQLAYQQQVQQASYAQAMGANPSYPMRQAQNAAFNQIFGQVPAAQTATMADVWKHLESSSHVWASVMDSDAKELIIVKFMEELRNEGGYIRKSAVHYVQLIDEMMYQNPTMLDNPFKDVLRVVAILEYDFDNGVDKERLARHVLGDQGYQQNLKRLGR